MDTFYLHPDHAKGLVRFTFSLRREVLEIAAQRLARLQVLWRAGEVSSC
jgi:hypothetical protein